MTGVDGRPARWPCAGRRGRAHVAVACAGRRDRAHVAEVVHGHGQAEGLGDATARGTIGAWVAAGQLRPIIENRYPLADAADAQRMVETARVRGKLVLVADPDLAASVPSVPAARG